MTSFTGFVFQTKLSCDGSFDQMSCISLHNTKPEANSVATVMILSFRTDMSGQTVQTQIRLQSDQGLHCLPFPVCIVWAESHIVQILE